MNGYLYSKWDGTQGRFNLDADELMDELGRNLLSFGNLSQALRLLQRGGFQDRQGRRSPSLEELMQRLRQKRQSQLEKYKLGSVLEEIRQKLDRVVKTEREGIQKRLNEMRQKPGEGAGELGQEVLRNLLKTMEERAAQNLAKLEALPKDIGGQIKELSRYDFMDQEAREQFQEIMDMLKRNALESYGRDLVQKIKDMDAGALAGIRHLVEAINQMLEQRLKGERPDFEGFMEQFGDFFGPQPPRDLDELIERLQRQIAEAGSLLKSLSPADREALTQALSAALDEGTQYELAKMAAHLEALYPGDRLRREYPFSGSDAISFSEALKLMEMLQKMDRLESQIRDSRYSRSLDAVDEKLVRELLGDEAARDLENLRNIARVLEEAGYLRWNGDKYELTPRAMRKIGQKALQDVYAQLRKDRTGRHNIKIRSTGGERTEETRQYEPGDEFQIHLQKTIMNSLRREPHQRPIRLTTADFEVFRTEGLTQSATVLMLDLSLSMPMRGNFEAAKRVAIALDGLIRSQYPRDRLYIVGFSSYAREVKKEDLYTMGWDEFDPYTNMQDGLYLARKLLGRTNTNNKEIILVTDGEPTAHREGESIFFQLPASWRTLQLTLDEVRHCTRQGIVINTFMLGSSLFPGAFVTEMARLNRGRVFYTSPDSLGQYLLVDYVSRRKKKI